MYRVPNINYKSKKSLQYIELIENGVNLDID
jgi:hypothetical protein